MARILYVEDNEVNRDMLSRRLLLEGYEVLLAADGEGGLARAHADRPDLIILDMSLPALDGWEVVRRLKSEPATRKIPVIALTAHAMAGDREKCLAAGCNDYDTKPVDVRRLLDKISSQLEKAPPPAPAEEPPAEPVAAGARILLVEDDENSRDFLSRRIALEGYEVETVADGAGALARLRLSPFDLVLLDVMLPVLSGHDVLERIRARWSMIQLPVIMVTARDRSQDVVEALRLGANDYVGKPVDVAVLLARMKTHLRVAGLEKELLAQKEFSENLIQHAQLMIVSVDRERRITRFNRAAERAFGYRAEEVLGRPVDLLYADPEEGNRVHVRALAEEGFTGEIRNRRKNGELFPVLLAASPLRDKHGRPLGVMGIGSDITKEKQLEAEREALARAKDDFLSIASHDLKNPLNNVLGFSVILKNAMQAGEPATPEMRQMVAGIAHGADMMRRIVADFLDFQALDDGRLSLATAPIDLAALARGALEGQAPYAQQKKVVLALETEGDLPVARAPSPVVVVADADRITQVLTNLLDNAIKFSPPGGRVTVRLENVARAPSPVNPAGGAVRLEVHDQGPGLSEEDLARVFVKYARLSAKPTGGEKSSGLGLSICKRLVELHGGEIGAKNNPDGGACFWFTLPLAAKTTRT